MSSLPFFDASQEAPPDNRPQDVSEQSSVVGSTEVRPDNRLQDASVAFLPNHEMERD